MATSAETRMRVGVEVEVADSLSSVRFWFAGRSCGVLTLRVADWTALRGAMEAVWMVEDFVQQIMEEEDGQN